MCQVVTRTALKSYADRSKQPDVTATLCYMTARMTLDVTAIGRRAALRRELLRLEQADVATKAGMSRAYVSRLENGGVLNPKLADLAAIADALGLSLDALIYGRPTDTSDVDLPNILSRRLGPDLGELVAGLDMGAANIEQGDVDAAIFILRSLRDRRAARNQGPERDHGAHQ